MTSPLSLLTLNLNEDPRTIAGRISPAVASLADVDAGVVCLQEVLLDPVVDGLHVLDLLTAGLDAAGHSYPHVVKHAHAPHSRGHTGGLAILSKYEIIHFAHLDFVHRTPTSTGPEGFRRSALAAAFISPANIPYIVITAHLSWGGTSEGFRLEEAYQIDQWSQQLVVDVGHKLPADAPAPVVVFAGDFNIIPQASTIRFLTGLQTYKDCGAFWVDAFEAVGVGDGYTSCADNPWSADTAQLVGIARPDLNPPRRIDYVMIKGWAHGKNGCPLEARVVCDKPAPGQDLIPSDHYGVLVRLLDE